MKKIWDKYSAAWLHSEQHHI